jgi:hypothetical protein
MKYVKRPIPIGAVQWQGRYGDPPQVRPPESAAPLSPDGQFGLITTDHGDLIIRKGDWVVGPGAVGEYWPVAAEVFARTYVPVEEN